MNVVVVLEYHFERTPNGNIWSHTQYDSGFWRRYLDVFDSVCVVARVSDVQTPREHSQRVDSDRIHLHSVPDYVGPLQYIRRFFPVRRAIRNAFTVGDAVLLRAPGTLATQMASPTLKIGYPYAIEVVGDPYDVFAPGGGRHPLRPIFRLWFTRALRQQCAHASAAAYVNASTLINRYPCAGFTTSYSSIQLDDTAFAGARKMGAERNGPFRLITIGSLAQPYKGIDVLINALSDCRTKGLDVTLTVVGDGRYRRQLENQVTRLGLSGHVSFCGEIAAGAPVRRELDQADVFVLASRTEGLPRAMIEAMARGLPCIGSNVGGIPELISANELVPAGDSVALADKIREVLLDPERMGCMARQNLQKAREYHEDILRPRRIDFYREVKVRTAEWLKMNSPNRTRLA